MNFTENAKRTAPRIVDITNDSDESYDDIRARRVKSVVVIKDKHGDKAHVLPLGTDVTTRFDLKEKEDTPPPRDRSPSPEEGTSRGRGRGRSSKSLPTTRTSSHKRTRSGEEFPEEVLTAADLRKAIEMAKFDKDDLPATRNKHPKKLQSKIASLFQLGNEIRQEISSPSANKKIRTIKKPSTKTGGKDKSNDDEGDSPMDLTQSQSSSDPSESSSESDVK